MSLKLLLLDELQGFVKSKITIILLIGLPALTIVMNFLTDTSFSGILTYFTTVLATSIAGALGSVMLSTSITSEMNKHVYDLFLIRPVKRRNIIIAKYVAVYLCLIAAIYIAICTSLIIDTIRHTTIDEYIIEEMTKSMITAFFALGITCSFGTLFGIAMRSVAASALLSLYVGNQASAILTLVIPLISQIMELEFGITFPVDPFVISMVIGAAVAVAMFVVALLVFERKQF
ncbi:MAG: ABC-2 transporter permease [Candidatus Lokiarchaeota archaeon]|nr:ABC-2 transporter permease [Candidatus Lokiarchaeota archaeon]